MGKCKQTTVEPIKNENSFDTQKAFSEKISSKDTKLSVVTNEGITLEQVEMAKLLGLELDSELSFSSHLDKLCRKLAQRIGILNKIKSCLPVKQRILYYNALIRSLMSYVSVVWHTCSKQDLEKVLLLQKRAGRVILDAKPRTSSVTLFNELGWIPFYEEAKISKCCILYRRIKNNVPDYLTL